METEKQCTYCGLDYLHPNETLVLVDEEELVCLRCLDHEGRITNG